MAETLHFWALESWSESHPQSILCELAIISCECSMNMLKPNTNTSNQIAVFSGPLQHSKSWKQGVLIVGSDTKTVDAQFAEAKISASHIHDFNV